MLGHCIASKQAQQNGAPTVAAAPAAAVVPPQGDSEMDAARRIWGTHYSQKDMQQMIRRFLTTFHARSPVELEQQAEDAGAGMATYVSLLRQVGIRRMRSAKTAAQVQAADQFQQLQCWMKDLARWQHCGQVQSCRLTSESYSDEQVWSECSSLTA